ncbi:protein FAM57B-like [Pomacea canaliculata]|uniref:protein FAM57B-like n=1 Tax=Pomacea canaliculata TaxID=400727 RepID=UPI000D736382|nr:protein FAM57B-like [Pomacea canaliculata]
MLIGAVSFPTIHSIVRLVLTAQFRKTLSLGDIFFISEKCTSSVQAIMSFLAGAIIVTEVSNIMTATHWLTNAYAWFATPYFGYDVWAMYKTYIWNRADQEIHFLTVGQRLKSFIHSSVLMLLHHTVLPLIIFPTIIVRRILGDFFVGTFYMIEITIPFIATQAVLAQLKLKDTPYYIAAGLLMVASFFVARILVFPYLFWNYAHHASIPVTSVPFSIPVKCNLGCLLILLPQLYWFGLMCRGTCRVFYKIYTRHKLSKSC